MLIGIFILISVSTYFVTDPEKQYMIWWWFFPFPFLLKYFQRRIK